MKRRLFFFTVTAYLAVCLVGVAYGTAATYVFGGSTQTVNETLGYRLSSENSTTAQVDNTTSVGSVSVDHGVRVYLVDTKGTLTELTNGSVQAVVTRSANGAGLQSTSWNCPDSENSITDCLLVRVYRRFGAGAWSLRASFLSGRLNLQLGNSTWVIYYYTYRSYAVETSGGFRWGNSTYYSRVENLDLLDLGIWDWADAYLKSGQFVSWLLVPYFNPLGELAYGLLLLTIAVPLYNRTENLSYVAVVFVLFGGTAGLLTGLVPALGLNLANILLLVGVGILAYRLIDALRHR